MNQLLIMAFSLHAKQGSFSCLMRKSQFLQQSHNLIGIILLPMRNIENLNIVNLLLNQSLSAVPFTHPKARQTTANFCKKVARLQIPKKLIFYFSSFVKISEIIFREKSTYIFKIDIVPLTPCCIFG